MSDQPFTSTDLQATINQAGVWNSYRQGAVGVSSTIAVNRTGRYVRVQLAGTNVLSLAEVQVLGAAAGGGPDIEWLVSDQLGTPRMILDQTGSLAGVKRHDYLPFGEELTAGRTAGQGYAQPSWMRIQWAGKERDSETGLDYFLARYYGSTTGRFISPDPILINPDRQQDPQTLNLYVYSRNNPLAYVDPTGMELVKLGQHTDEQIQKRLAEIDANLKQEGLTQKQIEQLNGERNKLLLEQEGNKVGNAFLAELDKIGERGGLKLSDLTLSTEPLKDLKSLKGGLTAEDVKNMKDPYTLAYVQRDFSKQIFLLQTSLIYKGILGSGLDYKNNIGFVPSSDLAEFSGTNIRHEEYHRDVGRSEGRAYSIQLQILNKFGPGAFMNKAWFNAMQKGLQQNTKLP